MNTPAFDKTFGIGDPSSDAGANRIAIIVAIVRPSHAE